MIVKGYQKEGNWIYVEWSVTFIMRWDQIVHAVNAAMHLFKDYAVFYGKNGAMLENVTLDVEKNGGDLVKTGLLDRDTDLLKVRGTMSDMSIDLTFINQSEFIQMTFYDEDGVFPEERNDALVWLYDRFGTLLNSMEIIGNVRFTMDMMNADD